MKALAKIHVLKKQAGLTEEMYRDLVERETGVRSAKGLSSGEHLRVISALDRLVPKTHHTGRDRATGPYARKLQALWIAGYNLGVIHNRTDTAMRSFLKRQTGLDHHRFLQRAEDADKAIDALKIWIRRATLNDGLFRKDQRLPAVYNDVRFQVCLHVWSELIKRDRAPVSSLSTYLFDRTGKDMPDGLSDAEWIDLQNDLGKLLRASAK
ncbi:regulatory protein GemA [Roseibium sp.]|uniref:regulatory protein GemA n=1 Tax=Roseibium sp. TaxID=1936156 RepID=UPI003A985597